MKSYALSVFYSLVCGFLIYAVAEVCSRICLHTALMPPGTHVWDPFFIALLMQSVKVVWGCYPFVPSVKWVLGTLINAFLLLSCVMAVVGTCVILYYGWRAGMPVAISMAILAAIFAASPLSAKRDEVGMILLDCFTVVIVMIFCSGVLIAALFHRRLRPAAPV